MSSEETTRHISSETENSAEIYIVESDEDIAMNQGMDHEKRARTKLASGMQNGQLQQQFEANCIQEFHNVPEDQKLEPFLFGNSKTTPSPLRTQPGNADAAALDFDENMLPTDALVSLFDSLSDNELWDRLGLPVPDSSQTPVPCNEGDTTCSPHESTQPIFDEKIPADTQVSSEEWRSPDQYLNKLAVLTQNNLAVSTHETLQCTHLYNEERHNRQTDLAPREAQRAKSANDVQSQSIPAIFLNGKPGILVLNETDEATINDRDKTGLTERTQSSSGDTTLLQEEQILLGNEDDKTWTIDESMEPDLSEWKSDAAPISLDDFTSDAELLVKLGVPVHEPSKPPVPSHGNSKGELVESQSPKSLGSLSGDVTQAQCSVGGDPSRLSTSGTPCLSISETPRPSTSRTPCPSRTGTHRLSTSGKPSLSTTETPCLSTSRTPHLSRTGTPRLSTFETSCLSTSETPHPSTSRTPCLSCTGTPRMSTSETPCLSTSEAPHPSTSRTPFPSGTKTSRLCTSGTSSHGSKRKAESDGVNTVSNVGAENKRQRKVPLYKQPLTGDQELDRRRIRSATTQRSRDKKTILIEELQNKVKELQDKVTDQSCLIKELQNEIADLRSPLTHL